MILKKIALIFVIAVCTLSCTAKKYSLKVSHSTFRGTVSSGIYSLYYITTFDSSSSIRLKLYEDGGIRVLDAVVYPDSIVVNDVLLNNMKDGLVSYFNALNKEICLYDFLKLYYLGFPLVNNAKAPFIYSRGLNENGNIMLQASGYSNTHNIKVLPIKYSETNGYIILKTATVKINDSLVLNIENE